MTERAYRIAFAALLLFVVSLSAGAYLGAVPTAIAHVPRADLAGHALLFGLLAWLLDGVLGHRPLSPSAPLLRTGPCLVLAAAAVDELAQGLSPRRTSCLSDFVADCAGAVVFVGAAQLLSRARTRSVQAV